MNVIISKILSPLFPILTQINLEGFEAAAEQNTTFAILVSIVIILFGIIIFLFKKYEDKSNELKKFQEAYVQKIDEIRKENMKKEDERNVHWRESEKETLTVLKGVNSVLEMSEKMKENDTEKIIDKIGSLEKSVNTAIEQNKKRNG
jgi:Na+/phosphate symporter